MVTRNPSRRSTVGMPAGNKLSAWVFQGRHRATKMLHDYDTLCHKCAASGDRQSLIDHLDTALPGMWQEDYLAMPCSSPNILIVTSGDEKRIGSFCRYMFDHASDPSNPKAALAPSVRYADDRVV